MQKTNSRNNVIATFSMLLILIKIIDNLDSYQETLENRLRAVVYEKK
jgi:hypothetical protein